MPHNGRSLIFATDEFGTTRIKNHRVAHSEPIKVDLACGQDKLDGWVGIDIAAVPGVDIVHDLLDFPWPLQDESVSEIRAIHFLEHIPMLCLCCKDQRDPLFRTFDEIYRVLVPGGTCFIACPHWSSVRAWQDPTHRRAISENTFVYANREWRENNKLSHYDISCDFSATWTFVTDNHGAVMDIHATLTKL